MIKRSMPIAIVAVAIVILVVAVAVFVVLPGSPNGDKTYSLTQGDWIKYRVTSNTSSNYYNMTFVIISINSTTIHFGTVIEMNGETQADSGNGSLNTTVFSMNPYALPDFVPILVGPDMLDLKWGMIETTHYNYAAQSYHGEIWLIHGCVAKQSESGGGSTMTLTAVDSNMRQFTDS